MSNLNPEQFGESLYHASNAKLRRGDHIVPVANPAHPDHHDYDWSEEAEEFGEQMSPHGGSLRRAYATTKPDFAEGYADYTYKVTPNNPEDLRHDDKWRGSYHTGTSGFRVLGLHSNRNYRELP